jgi:alpha-tubulin suppressor-like RCC1 family protein
MLNTANGNLNGYAFGSGIYGQLGCGSNRNFNYPVNIKL